MKWTFSTRALAVGFLLAGFLLNVNAQSGVSNGARLDALPDAPSATHVENVPLNRGQNFDLEPGADPQNSIGPPLLKHLAQDQVTFWTAPSRLGRRDIKWILPFAGFTGTLIASDSWFSHQVSDNPDNINRSQNFSDYALYSLIGVAGGSYMWGLTTKNDHLRETGFLATEAFVNSTAVTYAIKGITQRERPLEGSGNGHFFAGGGSFPSEHAAAAWSIASVLAHEYPGTLTKILAYGAASGITISRLTGQKHFPSDVFIGSALGWYFGRQIYRARHDPELGGTAWGDFLESTPEPKSRNPKNMGSPYVSMDSWVYASLDRLAALGFIHTGYAGMRPWTRMECARLLEEAAERVGHSENSEVSAIYRALATEFADETHRIEGGQNLGLSVDSVYSRFVGISGPPLRDAYHFQQTITNDNGRPYAEGFNNISGIKAHAVAGPLSIDVQAEYQHSPAVASDPASVLEATAAQDETLPVPNGRGTINRLRLVSGAAALTLGGFQFSFGKQSLWLGPGDSGPFMFSDNAEPIPMFRIDQVSPGRIPGLSRLLGPVRTEFFLGQLSGHNFVNSDSTLHGPGFSPQPFIHGSKISFKPTKNLEFGFAYTILFGGPGMPFTWHNFLRTFTRFNEAPGSSSDPGDRRSTFEFSYRVPYLRDWLTIYADSYVEDEISPLGSTRPSMRMGMYFPRIPKVPKLDLRLEGLYTDVPGQQPTGFIYWNGRYRSGYTNDGQLLASWIGREGRGGQAWATYWMSPRSKIQLAYRHAEADREYVGGGRLNDFGIRGEWAVNPLWSVSGGLQYEQWKFPVLSKLPGSNTTASVQVTFYPQWRIR